MKSIMLFAFAALACAALAQEPEGTNDGPRKGSGHGPRVAERGVAPRGGINGGVAGDPAVMAALNPRVAAKIGLPDEVQLQLKKIDLDSRKALRELQQKTKSAMEKQATLLQETKIDEQAVMTAIDELFELRKQMAKEQTHRLIAVKELLTPEQLAKALEEMKRFREEHRGGRRKKGQEDGPKKDPQKDKQPAAE